MKFPVTDRTVRGFLLALKGMGIESYVVNKKDTMTLSSLQRAVRGCRRCNLASTRRNVVFGEGDNRARVVFVGEAPGEEEDIQGKPFVGRAGKLLDQLIEQAGQRRESVYICNILKCRPPNNRDPEGSEIALCKNYLLTQIDLIKPKIICTLGRHAYNTLMNVDERITRVRGILKDYRGMILLPTYHPSFLLRNQDKIKEALEDMERLKQLLKV
ncbi:MAG: uracil-DNA glycosylase [Syntrophorhabdus sp.]|jgi:DNA polymerase|nr:uracil-DNA glycosylase [Syntrophorhabdus sp.]MDI9559167.1 uracil-DNA glycosylase [Pseudomonadota bacterium]HQP51998.1 uracil-DNA glycosylase [Syntrophorhabdaceae bacterium]HNQ46074.1 uracil-DNA glycosylase [Syntrophorhabdus sp.]HNS78732.1 uracil-DNA glycosylase [Syntrophorhabdus sp.]